MALVESLRDVFSEPRFWMELGRVCTSELLGHMGEVLCNAAAGLHEVERALRHAGESARLGRGAATLTHQLAQPVFPCGPEPFRVQEILDNILSMCSYQEKRAVCPLVCSGFALALHHKNGWVPLVVDSTEANDVLFVHLHHVARSLAYRHAQLMLIFEARTMPQEEPVKLQVSAAPSQWTSSTQMQALAGTELSYFEGSELVANRRQPLALMNQLVVISRGGGCGPFADITKCAMAGGAKGLLMVDGSEDVLFVTSSIFDYPPAIPLLTLAKSDGERLIACLKRGATSLVSTLNTMRACHRDWAVDALREVNSIDMTLTHAAAEQNLHKYIPHFLSLKEVRITFEPLILHHTRHCLETRMILLKRLRDWLDPYGHVRVEALGEWPHSLRLVGRRDTPPDAINLATAVQENRRRASGQGPQGGVWAKTELTEGDALFLAEFPFVWLPRDNFWCVLMSRMQRRVVHRWFHYFSAGYAPEFVRDFKHRFPSAFVGWHEETHD